MPAPPAKSVVRRFSPGQRRLAVLALVALLSALVAHLALRHLAFLTQIERTVGDIHVATALPGEAQDQRVVIVAITEDTLARFPYRSPVDRGFLAELLRTLEQRRPAAIGLDVLLDQPTEPEKDEALKAVLASLSVPAGVSYTDNRSVVGDAQLDYLNAFLAPALRMRVEMPTDINDIVRWVFDGAPDGQGGRTLGFARAMAAKVGVETPDLRQEMVWHGRPDAETGPFPVFPAHMVPFLPAQWFEGKIVLIGAMVTLSDRHRTPFSTVYGVKGDMAGIEVHAHAVSQLLDGRQTRRLGLFAELLLLVALAGLGTLFGSIDTSMRRHVALSLVTLGLVWPAGFALLYFTGKMVPMIEPTIGFLLAQWLADAFTGREARRQREFINGAFARYLNPQLVRQLSADPGRLALGGETRTMTLLFCDVRGFTTISEQFDAQGLTRLINRFLTPMTEIILGLGGTIDKYMGDCIMAFWNAPLDDPDHAANACRAALAMRRALAPLNESLKAEADAQGRRHIPINIGIGLNSGDVVVGNMGSDQRFDYSVLGDAVNLASRLEGQSKLYGVTVVIGESTREMAGGFACLELDLIKVKGKTEAVRIHALLGEPEEAETAAFRALAAEHRALLDAYRGQDWAAARVHLARCRDLGGDYRLDGLYALYETRIADYEAAPPGAAWDGVYVALTK